jgi:DNA-binding transcriptional LysR family regulator
MDVHLRELRYFVAVAEHLHFTHAAEALHISQPALSKQIRSLEADLRALLFVRHRRTVTLTAAGAALLPQARAVLDAWSQAEQGLAAATAVEHATLSIGISTGLGRGLLPAVRVRLAESAPLARLQIHQVLWGDPTGGLAADDPGRNDAAFVWLPVPNPQLYEWLEVSIEPRLIALPASHPLASRQDLDITDVLDEAFLALPAESGALRDYWLANDFRAGRPPLIAAEIASTEETVEALIAGLGVCLIAAGNAPLIAREGVAIRQITGLTPARLALLWRRDDERPLLAHLRTAIRAVSTSGAHRTPALDARSRHM